MSLGIAQDAGVGKKSEGHKDLKAGRRLGKPLATITAGKYRLEVMFVEPADPTRSTQDIAYYLAMQSFEQQSDRHKEQFGSAEGGGNATGLTFSGSGGAGGGGSFRSPNAVIGVRIVDAKTNKPAKDAFFAAGYKLQQPNKEISESTLPPVFLSRYVWADDSQTEKDMTPFPVHLQDGDLHSIQSLDGTLVVLQEDSVRLEFSPDELNRRTRKTSGKFTAQIASLESKDDAVALSLAVGFPADPRVRGLTPGGMPDFEAMMKSQMSGRVIVYVEDTDGGIHFGQPQNRGGGVNSFNSSFAVTGSDGIPKRGSSQKKSEPPQTFPFLFSALPDNASTRKMICEVRRASGAAEVIPFSTGEIMW
ncbi:MAG: hypothetical protein ACK58L_08445 [Planctomycetota bacterium]